MPVNPAETKFFELLAAQATQSNKLLPNTSIHEFRAGSAQFMEHAGTVADVSFKNAFATARDGYQIPIRIYNDDIKKLSPVLIFYPGCGYIQDLFELNGIACSRIAEYSGIKVILVNYRLAPENPLPTSIYDGYDAARFIAIHANEFGIDPKKIFIGGLSSGAHCAAVIANLARQDKTFTIYHQILYNGCYDATGSLRDYLDYEKEDKMTTPEVMGYVFNHWTKPDASKNPLISPYYEPDLSHLPTTTIIVGEYDGVRSHSEAYYKKLKAAGNKVEKIILPGQTHNTMLLRATMSDGVDPAQIFADVIKKHL